ncbi:hypothetical protein ABN239_19900 [Providencia vermicola]|uniref:hypothetical protein n=1 Tax=Providencia vermicola TaxID=333965 RepID=UPI0032DB5BC9
MSIHKYVTWGAERSQRTYHLKNDEEITLFHFNFLFPLNNSSEKKAVNEDIPRSIHKYVTWGAERSQRTYRLKNDEEITLFHFNFLFPLNNSSEKKAVNEDIPRSIHKYVTWGAERSQRTYRLKNDEEITLFHFNFLFPLNNSSEKKAVNEDIPRSIHKYVTWGAERSQRTYHLKNDEEITLFHFNFLFPLNNSSEKKAVNEDIPRSIHKYVTWGAERSQRTYHLKNDEEITLFHFNFLFPLNNSSEKKAVNEDIPRSIHKYVTWGAERSQRTYRLKNDEESLY